MLYAPLYYKEFKCIADKCTHSCCIGWEIDIDEEAAEKYKSNDSEYSNEVLKSIDFVPTPHFRLSAGERCPHLNETGLCKIILNMGEDFLCHICSEHPRFYNETVRGDEVGVGMACEEASRLILSSDSFDKFVLIENGVEYYEKCEFDALKHRQYIYRILSDDSLTHQKRLEILYNEYNFCTENIKKDELINLISSLEYLDEKHKSIFENFDFSIILEKQVEEYLKRALAYYVYRHCSSALDFDEFLASLGFCFFLERLFACSLKDKAGFENAVLMGRIISEELEYSEDNTSAVKNFFYDRLYLTNERMDDNINV